MRTRRRSLSLALLAAAVALTAAASFRGPPTVRVTEVTGTPPTPGAVLQVVATHHTDEQHPQVTARAVTLKDGKQVSQEIVLTPSSRPGVYGVTKQWEQGKAWVLLFTVMQGDHGKYGTAEALVKVDARGRFVSAETVKGEVVEGHQFSRKATHAEVQRALETLN